MEATDESIFARGGFDWNGFVIRRRPVVIYRFRVWSEPRTLAFQVAELVVAGWPRALPVIEVTPNGIFSNTYKPPVDMEAGPADTAPSRRQLPQSGNTPLPDRTMTYGPITGTQWATAFDQLRRVRSVAPHRVAADRLPLATTKVLSADGRDLATYLQTLQTNSRKKFQAIEQFVVGSFPEYEGVNPISDNNQATIRLALRGAENEVSLSYCGTGVEQLLTLAAMITASQPGDLVLMDEPHSYLHPAAERAFLRFVEGYQDRYLVIATHSSVLINGVAPDRLTYLQAPGKPYEPSRVSTKTSIILHDLGYRNSDALFFDRLVVVEGPSDAEVLPALLRLHPRIRADVVQNTGFPTLDGVNDTAREIQTKILKFEKLLEAVGRAKMPRLYLLDGDREPDDIALLAGTRNPVTDEPVAVTFLPRTELENYLLVPDAILPAITEESSLVGAEADVDLARVRAKLAELLEGDDHELFPRGHDNRMQQVKASRLLERLYDHFGRLRYDKKKSGRAIAQHMTRETAVGLDELIGQLDILAAA